MVQVDTYRKRNLLKDRRSKSVMMKHFTMVDLGKQRVLYRKQENNSRELPVNIRRKGYQDHNNTEINVIQNIF